MAVTFPSYSLYPLRVWVIITSSSGILLVERTALASAGTPSAPAAAVVLSTLPTAHSSPRTGFLSVYLVAFKVPFRSFLEGS